MAAINFVYKQKNTQSTLSNTTYADIDATDATIDSSDFTAGKKYLLIASCSTGSSAAGGLANIRVVHGSTAFADSELVWLVFNSSTPTYKYSWFTVWTAVSGEAIKMQNQASGGTTQRIDYISLLAINLSDDLVENTDWELAENTGPDALSTTPLDGATFTFTPSEASDWLIMTATRWDPGDTTNFYISNITRSGEASSSVPALRCIGHNSATYVYTSFLSRVFALTAVSNTFKEVSSTSGGTAHVRNHSKIFRLNLNKFAAHASIFTSADTATLSATNFATEAQTLDLTPTVTGTVFIGASWAFDIGSYARFFKLRGQTYEVGQSQVDQPSGQTASALQYQPSSQNSGAEIDMNFLTAMSMTGGLTYRTDLDVSADNTSGSPTAQDRSLWMFTAELASTSNDNTFQRAGRGVLRGVLRGGR